MNGEKAVIFAGGTCNAKCYYCPLPESRQTGAIWVNEEKIQEIEGILEACEKAEAEGASITGGEPLLYLDGVVKITKLVKETLGKKFHVHTYTNGLLATKESMMTLAEAGVDEIRMHPVGGFECIKNAVGTIPSVGIEVPVIPGESLIPLIDYANRAGADFFSLVEMEFSTANREELLKRGFQRKGKSWAVKGSREQSLKYLEYIEKNTGMHAHHCTIEGREQIQVPNRKINGMTGKNTKDAKRDA